MTAPPFDLPNDTKAAAAARPPTDRDGWTLSNSHWLLELVEAYDREDPRSLQRHIGPSEIGSPCDRKLALKALHAPQAPYRMAWRTRVGTAVHAWLAAAIEAKAPRGSLLTELGLYLDGEGDDEISGSADVIVLRSPDGSIEVADWKVPGRTTMKAAKAGRIKVGYRKQGMIYGLMLEETLGMSPTHVTIIFLPAAGEFHEAVVARRPYDRAEAVAAIERYKTIRDKAKRYGLAGTLRRRPKVADDYCQSCPFMGTQADIEGERVTLCRGYSAEVKA